MTSWPSLGAPPPNQTAASLPTPGFWRPTPHTARGSRPRPRQQCPELPEALSPAHNGQEMLESPSPALQLLLSVHLGPRSHGASPLGFQAGQGTSPGELRPLPCTYDQTQFRRGAPTPGHQQPPPNEPRSPHLTEPETFLLGGRPSTMTGVQPCSWQVPSPAEDAYGLRGPCWALCNHRPQAQPQAPRELPLPHGSPGSARVTHGHFMPEEGAICGSGLEGPSPPPPPPGAPAVSRGLGASIPAGKKR